jgi:hypothetical protein
MSVIPALARPRHILSFKKERMKEKGSRVQGQSGLHSKTLLKRKRKRKKKQEMREGKEEFKIMRGTKINEKLMKDTKIKDYLRVASLALFYYPNKIEKQQNKETKTAKCSNLETAKATCQEYIIY